MTPGAVSRKPLEARLLDLADPDRHIGAQAGDAPAPPAVVGRERQDPVGLRAGIGENADAKLRAAAARLGSKRDRGAPPYKRHTRTPSRRKGAGSSAGFTCTRQP